MKRKLSKVADAEPSATLATLSASFLGK